MSAKKIILAICRVIIGCLFVFSGFVKADDPLGFSYKLGEYFEAWKMDRYFPDAVLVYMSMAICVLEMFVGVCLLIGVFRKFTAWMLLLMMLFFTFLTFDTAYYGTVLDCGCFGDAIHLSPWQTFSKDVLSLALVLPIFFNQQMIRPIFPLRPARTVGIFLLLAAMLFTMYSYYYLPPIDFRPYADGKNIVEQMKTPPAPKDSVVMTFVYQNKHTGEKVFITMDQLSHMDSAKSNKFTQEDTFVTRKDVHIRHGLAKIFSFLIDDEPPKAPIADFSITSLAGPMSKDSDLTQAFLSEKGYRLMIVQYDIEKSSYRFQPELNKLVRQLMQDGKVKIWPISGSIGNLNDGYIKSYGVPYSFYTADATMLKTIIRSNPGLVLFHDNTVVHKWPCTALPSAESIYACLK